MSLIVKVVNGHIEEYENGSCHRIYGGPNIVSAATDGRLVAAVTKLGRVEEYVNGCQQRSYGMNVQSVQVSGGTVAVTRQDGRIEEYENGCLRRTY